MSFCQPITSDVVFSCLPDLRSCSALHAGEVEVRYELACFSISMQDDGCYCTPDPLLTCAAEEVAEDVKGPVVLGTASGRGPAEVRAYHAEQGRVVEGVSADSYYVEPSLVADDAPLQAAVPDQAPAPMTANMHNNAAAESAPVPAPAPDQEPARAASLAAPVQAATAPAAGTSPMKGSANAHNNLA